MGVARVGGRMVLWDRERVLRFVFPVHFTLDES